MPLKHLNKALLFLALPLGAWAQAPADSMSNGFHLDHSIGVQVNKLTAQILSLNNNNAVNDNPFLLTYNITERRTGLGLRIGAGYEYQKTDQNESNLLNQSGYTTSGTQSTLALRVGAEKKFQVAAKWTAGVGIDYILRQDNQKASFNYVSNGYYNYDSTITTKQHGLGAMAWLRFNISKKITLGTEMSFYYMQGERKTKASYTNYTGPGQEENFTDKLKEGKVNLPVVFYLALNI